MTYYKTFKNYYLITNFLLEVLAKFYYQFYLNMIIFNDLCFDEFNVYFIYKEY